MPKICKYCQSRPVPKGFRLYCEACSPLASVLWKRRMRKAWVDEWREGGRQKPHPALDNWPSPAARREYYRAYMRAYRDKKRSHAVKSSDCEIAHLGYATDRSKSASAELSGILPHG